MIFQIKLTLNKDYYEEAYGQILSLSKVAKARPFVALFAIGLGIILAYFQVLDFLPIGLIMFGLLDFYMIYSRKMKIVKAQIALNIDDQTLEFNDRFIKYTSKSDNGTVRWSDLKGIKKTKKGIILEQTNGVATYLPFNLLVEDKQVEFILSKTN